MNTQANPKKITSLQLFFAIVLSIAVLVAAQMLSLVLSALPLNIGVPSAVCNILAGIFYAAFAFAGIQCLCRALLKVSLPELRAFPPQFKPVWLVSAFVMPALVLGLALLAGGHWEVLALPAAECGAVLTGGIFFYGLAAGFVEELVFRGVIMGCLEKRFHLPIAVLVPSVLFGLVHIIGNELDFVSTIQLLIAGSIVGILFSLIAYESHSIWNSAIVHGVWNMAMIGGILHIGSQADSTSLFNFVLDPTSFLISGGDFGIEASVFSIFAYLVFTALAVVLIRKKEGEDNVPESRV